VDADMQRAAVRCTLWRMRTVVVPPALTRGPFTARTAEQYGVTPSSLRGRTWRRLLQGVWILATTTPDRSTWLAAARLVMPVDAVVCGLSAVTEHGPDVRRVDDVVVHVGFTRSVPRRRAGLRLRELTLLPDEVVRIGRWLVTSAARTAYDCARWLPLVEAVVVVDALLHAGLTTPEEIAAVMARHRGERWISRVGRVLSLADGRSESPMESRLRLLLVRAGLGGLEPQFEVYDAGGVFVGRLDLAYVDARVAVEYDGAWHWQQRREDDRRRDALRALGWTIVVVSAEDYYGDPQGIVRTVRAELARAAAA
jgi:very-short-patch-repair endonuclease